MCIKLSNRVNLDVKSISRQEQFVNKVTVNSDAICVLLKGATLVSYFSKKLLAATSLVRIIVDMNIVILGIERLLHEWLLQFNTVDQYVVFEFLDVCNLDLHFRLFLSKLHHIEIIGSLCLSRRSLLLRLEERYVFS
jgi:hypothetical protein